MSFSFNHYYFYIISVFSGTIILVFISFYTNHSYFSIIFVLSSAFILVMSQLLRHQFLYSDNSQQYQEAVIH